MNKPTLKELLRKKEKDPSKEDMLEKNDFLALMIAGFSVFLPVLLIALAVLALFIIGWLSFYHGL